MPAPRPLRDRFWDKVPQGDRSACWEWQGARSSGGYGRIWTSRGRAPRRTLAAHRVSWELRHLRQVPSGCVVRHSCDNPPCVNPDHLLVGTQADNVADRVQRGRSNTEPTIQGQEHPHCRLTNAQVRAMRARFAGGESQEDLAIAFGTSQGAVSGIVRGHKRKAAGGPISDRQPLEQVGESHPRARLTERDVLDIRRRAAAGEPYRVLVDQYGIRKGSVSNIVHRRSWRHI